jgi:hypothetical protein
MPIKKLVQELQVLETPKVEALEENETLEEVLQSSTESIQAPKIVKPRTQKQIDAFTRAREIKSQNAKNRQDDKKAQNDIRKKELEHKLVQKAISVKKKQIKQEQILDEISDDEEEEITYTPNPLKVPVKAKVPAKAKSVPIKHLLVKEKSKFLFV